MVGRICKQCGEGFMVKPHKVREGKGLFCSRPCASRAALIGKRSRAWKGGRHNFEGYIALHAPEHPNASVQGGRYVLEHRKVASEMLGRPLTRSEIVHHVNGNKTDNRPENLLVMTQSEHMKLHRREQGATHGV